MGNHTENYTCLNLVFQPLFLVAWFTTNIQFQMSSIFRPTSSNFFVCLFVYKSTEQEGYTDFAMHLQWYDNYALYCIEQNNTVVWPVFMRSLVWISDRTLFLGFVTVLCSTSRSMQTLYLETGHGCFHVQPF